MLSRARYFASDVAYWLSRSRWRVALALAALVALAAAAYGGYLLATSEEEEPGPAPAPQIVVPEAPEPEEAEDLGFPAFATRNTTRVGGADSVAAAAGAALAAYPSTGGLAGPAAVTLVDAEDWHAGIAAASLVAGPVGAPVLVTAEGEIPELTEAALAALDPGGSAATEGERAFQIGEAAAPDDLEPLAIEGQNPAQVAVEIERLRTRLAGEPQHILLVSSDQPEFAMPAAAWAARSGDPILFLQRDSIPGPTRDALERHEEVPAYVLGPPGAISQDVLEELDEVAARVERVGGADPVANAVEFARYVDGPFGWNINDPGHGLVIASVDRPLDAAVAAPLSVSGAWGPLLLTDDPTEIPPALRAYLLDLKPGYEDDPTRAVTNHVWLIGDPEAISVAFQARVDELVELVPVSPGRGPEEPGATPPDPGDLDAGDPDAEEEQ